MNEIFIRRSIRKYKQQAVEREKIQKILQAAMQAPSAGNQQPWEFIVVEDKQRLEQLSLVSPYAGPVKNAPLTIVVLANKSAMKFPENWQMDLSAATENLLLEAVHLGLGAVWLGIAPVAKRMDNIRTLFALPDYIEPFAMVAIGYPQDKNKFIDRFNSHKIHFEQYKEV
jgi:nitroreductase